MLFFRCALLHLVVGLLWPVFLPGVSALGSAGSIEIAGPFYRVYRISIAVWGANQRKMFPHLIGRGTHKDGGANALEVVNHLYNIDLPASMFSGIDLDNPGVKDLATILHNARWPDPSNEKHKIVKNILLQRVFEGFSNEPNNVYPKIIGQLVSIFEQASRKAAEEGDFHGKVEKHKFPILDALEKINELRTSDMLSNQKGTSGLVKDFAKMFPGAKLVLTQTPFAWDETQKISVIDLEETIKQSPAGTLPSAKELRRRIRNYGKDYKDSSTSKGHLRMIGYWKGFLLTVKRWC
ncbi:hypothetical protein PMIN06_003706 [Paraphaeosphaeria minitans]|uniref:Uncharacterized protein n=1 Tax=Paraphaeosphaeria minitans TaxID=565426 RepID=A0A9P6GLA7_9PLEO|nr:hypothetical protein PMIN01_05283 [Paraphaeosphaeria minitans]